MELSGKVAVVTGASRGIGRALAKELAASGCSLFLTALERAELNSLTDELRRYPVSFAATAADLSNAESLQSVIGWILKWEGGPDILVNNAAAGGRFGRFEAQGLDDIDKTISLNVSALVRLTRELIPCLKRKPSAKIVNISSGVSRLPYPGLAIYGATKAFVSSFSESLACELSGTSVNVLCFHPGFTMTSFISTSGMDLRKIPSGFLHTPESMASRLVRAIRRDRPWVYSDFTTRALAAIGGLLPSRLRTTFFKDLFWRLPDEIQNSD